MSLYLDGPSASFHQRTHAVCGSYTEPGSEELKGLREQISASFDRNGISLSDYTRISISDDIMITELDRTGGPSYYLSAHLDIKARLIEFVKNKLPHLVHRAPVCFTDPVTGQLMSKPVEHWCPPPGTEYRDIPHPDQYFSRGKSISKPVDHWPAPGVHHLTDSSSIEVDHPTICSRVENSDYARIAREIAPKYCPITRSLITTPLSVDHLLQHKIYMFVMGRMGLVVGAGEAFREFHQSRIDQLSLEERNNLYYHVWLQAGCPNEIGYGERNVLRDPDLFVKAAEAAGLYEKLRWKEDAQPVWGSDNLSLI
ncbi:MAG: hypothetical protein V4492_00890 [Chlamydiota bacterium]